MEGIDYTAAHRDAAGGQHFRKIQEILQDLTGILHHRLAMSDHWSQRLVSTLVGAGCAAEAEPITARPVARRTDGAHAARRWRAPRIQPAASTEGGLPAPAVLRMRLHFDSGVDKSIVDAARLVAEGLRPAAGLAPRPDGSATKRVRAQDRDHVRDVARCRRASWTSSSRTALDLAGGVLTRDGPPSFLLTVCAIGTEVHDEPSRSK